MTGVEYVREICKQKGLAIRKLELDLGFLNGYLNPKKQKKYLTTRQNKYQITYM